MIERLKEYFSGRKEVAFAFLFGSQARGDAGRVSDVDVAVYFYPKRKRPIEFEEEVFYKQEDEIWAELDRLLNREVDLLVLNRVPATVAASAIQGTSLVIKEWGLYLDFMLAVTSEAEDFREFVIRDFWERAGIESRK